MATGTEIMGAVILVVEAGATLTVAARVARRLTGPDPLDRTLTFMLVALAQVVGILLVLGSVDLLGRWPVLIAHLVVLGVTVAVVDDGGEPMDRPTDFASIATVAALAALWLRLSIRIGGTTDYDSHEYHIANLASWFQRHNIWHLPYANPGFITATHPGNGELTSLWLVLPTGSDQLAYAAPLAFAILAIVGVAFLARELGGSPRGGAMAATAVIACPLFFVSSVRSLQTDLAAAAGLVIATGLLLRFLREERTEWLVLAGTALGMGVGAKYTVTVPAALLVVIAVVIVRHRTRLLVALPGLIVFAGPWLLRNALTTGNPLFPEDVTFAGLTILHGGNTPLDVLSTRMLSHIVHRHTDVLRSWFRLVRHFIGWAVAIPVVGVGLAWLRRSLPVLVVAVMAIGSLVSYLVTPYTGGGAAGYLPLLGSNQRYLLPALLLGCALFATVLSPRISAPVSWAILGYDIWWAAKREVLRPDIKAGATTVAAAVIVGVVIAALVTWRRETWWRWLPVPAAVVAVGAIFVEVHHVDRTGPNAVEVALDKVAPHAAAVEVMGVGDLRSVLGVDLRRPLVLVAAGGRAHERPFTDRALVTLRYLSLPPPPSPIYATLGHQLDAALLAAGRSVLVLGPPANIAIPLGWSPDKASWCVVAQFPALSIYGRTGTPACG